MVGVALSILMSCNIKYEPAGFFVYPCEVMVNKLLLLCGCLKGGTTLSVDAKITKSCYVRLKYGLTNLLGCGLWW